MRDAELNIKRLQWGAPIIVALITALIGGYFTWAKPAWREPLEEVKREMTELKANLNIAKIESRLSEVESVVKDIKRVRQYGGPKKGAPTKDTATRVPGATPGAQQ